ncbi:FecR family protein [Flavobacterium paronense]|uniref:FecR family protein n=1 Tax=Flavobacterium paronense TaxID=1392775 RepID=A0ABV5GCC2_9FLAO|nr:FecR family protein [Flavobacterium paronense]MDN3677872.1 FecR family protein [Flavobacterium paronense]
MKAIEEKYELAKWLAGEMTEKELQTFQNTAEYATYVKIAEYSSQLKAPDFDTDLLYQSTIKHKKSAPKVIPFYQSKWMRVAAIFVVLLGLTLFFRTTITSTEIAENGKKTSFSLPDNSQIVLNSGSEIEYKQWNWDNNRKLNLQGEAYFKVAHGKKFQVNTNLGTVTVLGTQFNVKARKNRFDVTCYEGRVKVNYNNKEVIITKGTSVTFDNEYFDRKNITAQKPEWTVNEIVFKKEKLQSIVDELQRQYSCEITLNCKENTQLFSGTLPTDDINTALGVVCSIFHLKISKFESKKIILVDF